MFCVERECLDLALLAAIGADATSTTDLLSWLQASTVFAVFLHFFLDFVGLFQIWCCLHDGFTSNGQNKRIVAPKAEIERTQRRRRHLSQIQIATDFSNVHLKEEKQKRRKAEKFFNNSFVIQFRLNCRFLCLTNPDKTLLCVLSCGNFWRTKKKLGYEHFQ